MKRDAWNARYASETLVWGGKPNRFVEQALRGSRKKGRALDVACGEGRNALWMASQGWRVTAIDFSRVAIERARTLATEAGVEVEFIEADATAWEPEPGAFDLVLIAYLQVPEEDFRQVLKRCARALRPDGRLFGIGHALRNLDQGVGGPQQAEVLWDIERLAEALRGVGFEVESIGEARRPVEGSEVDAIDLRVEARRRADGDFRRA